jgi:hypothetical protein
VTGSFTNVRQARTGFEGARTSGRFNATNARDSEISTV